jgi:general secretion pathway protein A
MYENFYGLRELPFELTPNPKYLYLTPRHQEGLSNLQYGLFRAKALTVLIGEAGTGKTTLLKAALESEACRNVRCVFLNNPTLTRGEFVEILARNFDLSAEAARSKAVLLAELENALKERRSRGEITALVVDEAQSLSIELLEEIRLLANFETATEKLLPLLLVGQPELGARLEDPRLRQLKQRVSLRCEITPFDLPETSLYIASRIRTAGGRAFRLFTRDADMLSHRYSRGIPRTINVMCDNALVNGLALGRQPVNQEIVIDVCQDFKLGEPAPAAAELSRPEPESAQALPPGVASQARDGVGDARERTGTGVAVPRRALPWEVAFNRLAGGFKR